MKKTTDKQLQKEFDELNERFFDYRLTAIKIGFKKMIKTDGAFNCIDKEIKINDGLRNFPVLTSIVLLHEMAHADLDLRGYKGYQSDGGHGMVYQAELDRLYKAGAYDGLL
jgi:SprT-like family protein